MNRSSKKTESAAIHEAQVGDVVTKLRAWAWAESELNVMLNHTATSVVIRGGVHELKEGIFVFFEPLGKVSVVASIKSFTRIAMTKGPGTCIHLGTRSGEGLTIFENISRRKDVFERFPEPSSTVQ